MTRWCRGCVLAGLVATAVAGLPTGAATAQAPELQPRFERSVDVGAAGWVKVPLDAQTRGRTWPGGGDLSVRDAAGQALPLWLVEGRGAPPSATIPGQLIDVAEVADGWLVTIDLGADPPAHWRLSFAFANRGVVPRVKLEASPDAQAWHQIAEANLFRLGEVAAVQGTDISYAPTTERYLRLAWPKAAGVPDLHAVSAEAAPAETAATMVVPLTVVRDDADLGGDLAAYRLTAPGRGIAVRDVALRWSGSGPLGYRFRKPVNGTWQDLAEGVLADGGDAGRWVTLPGDPSGTAAPAVLRLELTSGGGPPPALLSAVARMPRPAVVFAAPAAGRYVLGYGGLAGGNKAAPDTPPPGALANAQTVTLGPEIEQAPKPLPAAALGLGARLDPAAYRRAWTLSAPGVQVGDLVRLTLATAGGTAADVPSDVYDTARDDLSDVRVILGDRQVPFVGTVLDAPVAAGGKALRPALTDRPGVSEITVSLGADRVPITQLELAAPAGPFSRPYTALLLRREAGTLFTDTLSAGVWACAGQSPLPCRLALPPPPAAPGQTLVVTFDDGDNAPLPDVTVSVWRRADALVFAWPGAGARLVAGNDAVSAPRYDLATVADDVLTRPAVAASIEVPRASPTPAPSPRATPEAPLPPWLLVVALSLATVVLLAVLAGVLRADGSATAEDAPPGDGADTV